MRPVNHTKETPICGRWRFTNTLDSWNWQGLEGEKAEIEVYADAAYVALWLNGKKVASRKIKNCKAKFTVKYQPGILEAVAYSADGTEISRSHLTSGTMPAHIKICADKKRMKADGQDICFLMMELVDENGAVYPAKETKISVKVSGAGQFIKNIGGLPCAYVFMALFADTLDHIEWKHDIRCDGIAMSVYNIIAVASVGVCTGIFNFLLAKAGYIAPTVNELGQTIAAVQPDAVRNVITFSFVGLEVITGIVLAILLIFLNVEKDIEKKQAEIKARHEKASGKE